MAERLDVQFAPKEQGFTLLELIIVVFLIALSAGFISTRLSHDMDREVEQQADKFASLTNYCKEEAIVTSEPVAIFINQSEGRYVFLRLGEVNWEEIQNDDVLRPRLVEEPVEVKIIQIAKNTVSREIAANKQEPKPKDKKKKKNPYKNVPLIVADSVGRLTPFEVAFYFEDAEYRVKTGADGRAYVTRRSEEDEG